MRVEKVLPPTALSAYPVWVRGRRACPPEEVGVPDGYDQRTLNQFSWRYEALHRLLAGEDIREADVLTWFWTFELEHFDKDHVNQKLAKLYHLEANPNFLLSLRGFEVRKLILGKHHQRLV